jgi:hypothetical protein
MGNAFSRAFINDTAAYPVGGLSESMNRGQQKERNKNRSAKTYGQHDFSPAIENMHATESRKQERAYSSLCAVHVAMPGTRIRLSHILFWIQKINIYRRAIAAAANPEARARKMAAFAASASKN